MVEKKDGHVHPPDPGDLSALVRANTLFAGALYSQVASSGSNAFFAPANMSAALAMTYTGARGETAAQMAGVLRLPALAPARLHAAFGALEATLRDAPGVELAVANALFGQHDQYFVPDFLALLAECYGAGLRLVDFETETELARVTINRWVKEQTRGKIADLLPRGILNNLTRLVLVSAVYFKGSWDSPFKEAATKEAPFFRLDGGSVPVPLMVQSNRCKLVRLEDALALELPYQGDAISMVVILPKTKDGLPAIEKRLPLDLIGWLDRFDAPWQDLVEVYLPRFRVEMGLDLKNPLENLGMPHAFDQDLADFSGMTGQADLCIKAAVHRAFVEVNEEGTTAAAATAVVMGARAIPPEPTVFRADHPFLFLIRDTRTKAVLFLGRFLGPPA